MNFVFREMKRSLRVTTLPQSESNFFILKRNAIIKNAREMIAYMVIDWRNRHITYAQGIVIGALLVSETRLTFRNTKPIPAPLLNNGSVLSILLR